MIVSSRRTVIKEHMAAVTSVPQALPAPYAGDWSRALVTNDVLLREASSGEASHGADSSTLQRSLAGCLQRMGCTHLLQTYWRSSGEASGRSAAPPSAPALRCQAQGMPRFTKMPTS